ncbi:MAG TPA: alpha-amylase family glycosyl hydrolase [Candidatus Acidoferrum sp.]|nr:alpha-amylase family glycosyl hydrolase [Candidatus Acidoferrum sp.]
MPTPFSFRQHPHIYEINTWVWLEELSARLGRTIALAGVPDSEWDALASQGFDIIWLMGVWRRSPESRRVLMEDPGNRAACDLALPGWKPDDFIASPYSVSAYTVDKRIGTWASLDAVREKLRARGMALFLDFVGNHTSLDHPWTQEHPEFYVQGAADDFAKDPSAFLRVPSANGDLFLARGRDPYFPPWKDALQINHFHPGARAAQIEILRSIAAHCDGVRCDMAMLLLSDVFQNVWGSRLGGLARPEKEFWLEVRLAIPRLTLLAEAYWGTEQRLLELGFSFTYDKELYDCVRDCRAWDARGRLGASADYQAHMVRFLENHDEDRRAVVFPNERLHASGTLMGTLPGARFYHQGELEGRKLRIPVTLRIAAPETPDPFSSEFFKKTLRITKEDVFHTGAWSLLDVASEGDDTAGNLIIYEWRSKDAWKVIAVNLSGGAAQGRVKLGNRTSPGQQYKFNDELNEVIYPRDGRELHDVGLFVRLEAGQAHLFDVTPA